MPVAKLISHACLVMPRLLLNAYTAASAFGMAALAFTVFIQDSALAQEVPTNKASQAPIEIIIPHPAAPLNAMRFVGLTSFESQSEKFAKSMSSAANRGLIQSGIEASKEAILECQKGDDPGGGTGLLSMPVGRPSSRTDHCFR